MLVTSCVYNKLGSAKPIIQNQNCIRPIWIACLPKCNHRIWTPWHILDYFLLLDQEAAMAWKSLLSRVTFTQSFSFFIDSYICNRCRHINIVVKMLHLPKPSKYLDHTARNLWALWVACIGSERQGRYFDDLVSTIINASQIKWASRKVGLNHWNVGCSLLLVSWAQHYVKTSDPSGRHEYAKHEIWPSTTLSCPWPFSGIRLRW